MPFVLTQEHWDRFAVLANERENNVREEASAIHDKKLRHLGFVQHIDDRNVNKRRRGIAKYELVKLADPIINLSSRQLDEKETAILSRGLKLTAQVAS